MKLKPRLLLVGWFALGACTASNDGTGGEGERYLESVPDAVLDLAAPYQNLDAVVLRPEDGCYWYRYDGPVETTLLPLRTAKGSPICTRAQTEPTAKS